MLDRDVVGFRPTVDRAIPLAPLAYLADFARTVSRSWNYQIEVKANWVDQYEFNAGSQSFDMAKGDGVPEFQAVITFKSGTVSTANVAFTFVGTTAGDFTGLNAQILAGLTPADSQAFGQPYALAAATNSLVVQGSAVGSQSNGEQKQLHDNLVQLQNTAAIRIWPLYSGVDGKGNVTLCGFVAGRVVTVESISGGQLRFVVQPTMLPINAAVTNATQRGQNGIPITNPYICKVRLVE
jgi:hypothetical protein